MDSTRRLAAVHAQLTGTTISPAAAAASEIVEPAPPSPSLIDEAPKLLSDERLQEFIANGAIELDVSELSGSFHAALHERAQEHHKSGRWPGSSNNIYSAMPELSELFQGPTCRGALESVLGKQYVMHAHRHMHVTGMNSFQQFHKDGQVSAASALSHRTLS